MSSHYRKVRLFGLVSILLFSTVGISVQALAAPDDISYKTSSNTDLTDIWWNPSESGWGLQMINTGTFIYVTIYVYGTDGKPTWYGGGMNKIGSGNFTGDLYVASGPYFGAYFDPTSVLVRKVGTVTFVASTQTQDSGQLTYSVDGVQVTKTIQRQPLTLDNYNGIYLGILTGTVTGCTNPANNGAYTGPVAIRISQTGTSMSIDLADASGTECTWSGTYSQLGRNGTFQSVFNCGANLIGNTTWLEMNNHVHQFNARFLSTNSVTACFTNARITALIPD